MDADKKLSVGERIRTMRLQKGMTQTQLALATGYSDKSAISRIESGDTAIPRVKLILIAAALNTSAAYLCGETDNPDILSEGDFEEDAIRNALNDKAASYVIRVLEDQLDQEQKRKLFNDILHKALNEHMVALSEICTDDKTEFFSSITAMRIKIVTRFVKENADYLKFKFSQFDVDANLEE